MLYGCASSLVGLGVVRRGWSQAAHMFMIMDLAWQDAGGHLLMSPVGFQVFTE